MKIRTIFLLFGILSSCLAHGQHLTIKVDGQGKVGFIDQGGKEVIKCIYESAYPFQDGSAVVSKNGKFGMVDCNGKVVLPFDYSSILPWTYNLYVVNTGKRQGLVDHTGKIVLQPIYTCITKPNRYGKALIAADGKYGIIDNTGRILIDAQWEWLSEFSIPGESYYAYHEGYINDGAVEDYDTLSTDCSYLLCSRNSKDGAGVIDGNGKILMPSQPLFYYPMRPSNGMIRIYRSGGNSADCGYYNIAKGKLMMVQTHYQKLSDIEFWTHGDFAKTIAPVFGKHWRFIDKDGNIVRKGYDKISHSIKLGLWVAQRQDGKCDVFDEDNNDIPVLSGYDDFCLPKSDDDKTIFVVKKDGKYGAISQTGETVIPFQYDDALANMYDAIPVQINGKCGAVSPCGEIIIPIMYEDMLLPTERGSKDFWVKKADGLYYHYHADTKVLASIGYEDANGLQNGMAFVRPTDMKLDNSDVNRAQLFEPYTDQTEINKVQVGAHREEFGYILGRDDKWVVNVPVSATYVDSVIDEIAKKGRLNLTDAEKRNILLDVTKVNRSYGLGETISEDEWDY